MHTAGKTLQILGLILLPLSMYLEVGGGLSSDHGISMVIMLIVGVILFVLGRFIEGYGGR